MSSDAEGDCSTVADKPKLPREVWLLVGANVVVALGYGVVAPVLPQYARHFGVSISAATFVITAFARHAVGRRAAGRIAGPEAGGAAGLHQRSADRRGVDRGMRVRADVLASCCCSVPWAGSARPCSRFPRWG